MKYLSLLRYPVDYVNYGNDGSAMFFFSHIFVINSEKYIKITVND